MTEAEQRLAYQRLLNNTDFQRFVEHLSQKATEAAVGAATETESALIYRQQGRFEALTEVVNELKSAHEPPASRQRRRFSV